MYITVMVGIYGFIEILFLFKNNVPKQNISKEKGKTYGRSV